MRKVKYREMRKVKYRGKIKCNGISEYNRLDWEIGSLSWYETNGAIRAFINNFGVYPETVGESTSIYCLKDGKKTEIFEGDILKIKQKFNSFADNLLGVVKWDAEEACFYVETLFDFYPMDEIAFETEIVGNIWDNPEMKEEI